MKPNIVEIAKWTIQQEWEAMRELESSIDQVFAQVVEGIIQQQCRLVITGIGKSGIIAQKWVATFNSTGQKAVFMHAADAIHGDLGMIEQTDWVICISKSGESPEIRYLVPLIQALNIPLIAVTANGNGFLGQAANHTLLTPMEKEACPNNLAPTTSTTLQLALGDALAVSLMELRGFNSEDFARFHPGGALGKKLTRKVADMMVSNDHLKVQLEDDFAKVISSISAGRVGAVVVMDNQRVVGIITDGDIRRGLEKALDPRQLKAAQLMGTHPKIIAADALAVEAFRAMEAKSITQLVVMNDKDEWVGMIHLHDLLREGIF
jgi:arabinose-5-phosphate isomerase